MSNLTKLLSLAIFIVAIWSVNSFLLPRVSNDTNNINIDKQQLLVKQSFSDSSPANLSKSVNEFVIKKFDKNELVNLIDILSRQSGIKISNLNVQANSANISANISNLEEDSPDTDSSIPALSTIPTKSNTLKSVDLSINISGNKSSIDLFLSKLVESKQYIDIQDINLDFSSDSTLASPVIDSIITAKLYYINL